MILSDSLVAILLIAALAGVLVLAVVLAVTARRLTRLRRAYASALEGSQRGDLFEAVQQQASELGRLREDLGVVHDNTEHLRDLLRGTVSRVGLVRYDAFDDMGGALSFSAALLDEGGSGVVISAINGRSETRAYAKAVTAGDSEHNLSTEEHAAIDAALAGRVGQVVATTRSRRRRVAS